MVDNISLYLLNLKERLFKTKHPALAVSAPKAPFIPHNILQGKREPLERKQPSRTTIRKKTSHLELVEPLEAKSLGTCPNSFLTWGA
jgi:hypothetical protein